MREKGHTLVIKIRASSWCDSSYLAVGAKRKMTRKGAVETEEIRSQRGGKVGEGEGSDPFLRSGFDAVAQFRLLDVLEVIVICSRRG
eukprot:3138398-Rhodomonas_salina.1